MANIYNVPRKHFASWFGSRVQTLSALICYQRQVKYRRSSLKDPRVSCKVRHKSGTSFPLGAVRAGQTPIRFKQALITRFNQILARAIPLLL